ncbi:MAG: DUF4365 domain-containing protein [Oscillatoria sp. SIO1A7]|nr:DUF4365 domain-containing protein [Oscillatoria sp. SIO1A7]
MCYYLAVWGEGTLYETVRVLAIFEGTPATPNRANITLELPRKNQFTAIALNAIIERIRQGYLP